MLLRGLVSGPQQWMDLAGDVAFEAPDDLTADLALADPTVKVGAGGRVPPQTGENDPVERGFGLPVTSMVEAPSFGPARGLLDRAHPAQRGEEASPPIRSGLSPAVINRAAALSGPMLTQESKGRNKNVDRP